ncbi:MAG: IS21 family transposase [Thermoleophilaceae bacterium]|nr:IS21 family transposase [Thermoleophilaceae bacterium]MDQ3356485.1 IS21 family transposase [Actinomycetota bacterium]
MIDVERWAELRREHFVRRVTIKELARRHGIDRNTVRRALRSDQPPHYERPPSPSKLDPFKDEIHRLLKDDSRLPGVRVRELIEPLGFDGQKTIVDDYLREVRPLFVKARSHQRTVYRPGEICQFDLWEPSSPLAVGHGQTRRAWVVVACLGYSRAGAGALIFSKEAPDVLFGMGRCLWSLGALPQLMVWDREGCLHAGDGRPTDAYAGFCGRLPVDWHFCEPADPQAKGCVERLQGYMETNFEPGRRFANERDFQLQLDRWFEKANARTHKTLRCRPIDRLVEERELMRALPAREPETDRRWVTRVPPDPHLRFDRNDYSLDPNLVGRRVEVRASQREITALCLDSGELAASHERSFAKNRTITALEHARALRERRGQPEPVPSVEQRPLAVYDALIA